MDTYTGGYFESLSDLVFYLSCILATTLWCTILIVFRIVSVIWVNNGADSRLGEYRHLIEVLVESSALHSVALIIYVAMGVKENPSYVYLDVLAAFTTVRTDPLFPEYIYLTKPACRELLQLSLPGV